MTEILVGTASWTDKTLIDCGRFYPADAKTPEARLRYYASQFRLVEVDSSYYALPASKTAQLWAERTPQGFVFDVKAFRLFTGHPAAAKALPADLRGALAADAAKLYYRDLPDEIRAELWRRFREALEPLDKAGKLGAVLLQFAPWVIANREGFAQVQHAAEKLGGLRVATEFRNRSWFSQKARERVLAFEREQGLIHVVVDEPQGFASSVPPVWEATTERLAILRLHGHNQEMWTKKGLASSAERFNYLYSTPELKSLLPGIQQLGKAARSVHVLFNNCFEDKAQVNARELVELLGAG
ncbi:MAG TPA: DUF72 domain-containing protein [Polyangiaceae bacterium]|nr:DUF72 domain-containing protein [Polyangiaceae bacterium]